MEKVILDDLRENSFFHFTHVNNYDEINKNGLKPIIGENAAGVEITAKTFFSIGEEGILKVMEVWLRWLMNRIYGPYDRLKLYRNETKEEQNDRLLEWSTEFISRKYFEDEEKKKQLFDYFYNYMKKRIYFVLDLEKDIDYLEDDIDENKVELNKSNRRIDKLFAKEMYGPFSDFTTEKMDNWNMHTKSNITIPTKKIKQVVTKDNKEDVISILMYIYEKYKDIPHDRFLLDDFIEYIKNKELKEGLEYDQDNNNRIY